MNIIIGSLRGSPGVTSLAVMLAHYWGSYLSRERLLIEADFSGGVLAPRYNLTQGNPGLLSFITKSRRNLDAQSIAESIKESCQHLPGGVPVIVGTGKNTTIEGLVKEIPLTDIKSFMPELDIFIDVGRIDISLCPSNLLLATDILLLVVHPYFEHLDPLLSQVVDLGMHKIQVGVVLQATPENSRVEYSEEEINSALESVSNGRAFVVAKLAYDRKAAHLCFVKGPHARSIKKSALHKSVRSLVFSLEKMFLANKGHETQVEKVETSEKTIREELKVGGLNGTA